MSEEKQENKFKIVTSFNAKMWHKYCSKTVQTLVDKYKGTDQEIYFWLDHAEELDEFTKAFDGGENFKFAALSDSPHFLDFQRKFDGDVPFNERGIDKTKIEPGVFFRYNYMPFAKKVYAWVLTYFNLNEGDVLVWIDADIVHNKQMESNDFELCLPEGFDISFLDRDRPWYAAETGFFMIRKSERTDEFVRLMLKTYSTGFIFDMGEWHDGYVFKTLLKLTGGMQTLNLNPVLKERDVFERTLLADYMVHFKGGKKNMFKEDQGQSQGHDTLIEFDPEEQGFE